MTALVSKIDFHNFGKYYFYKFKKLRACFLIQMVAALLSYPLAAVSYNTALDFFKRLDAARDAYYNAPPGSGDTLFVTYQALNRQNDIMLMLFMVSMFVAATALAVIVFMHFITPLISFNWLYKKSCADMDYSLPVSSDARFWGDFLAGFTVVVPPHLISIILGLIMAQSLHDLNLYGVDDFLEFLIPLLWTGFLGLIMLYSLTILIMGCCGKIFHAAAMPILVNIAVPVTHYFLFWLGQNFAAGNWSSSAYMRIESIFVTSPLGMVLSSLMAGYYTIEGVDKALQYFTPINCFPIQQSRYLIPALIVTALFILAAWLVIRRRNARQVGAKAFAVKPAQYIIHGLAALMMGTLAAWQISLNFDDVLFFMGSGYTPDIYDIVNIYSVLLLMAVPVVYIILELAAGEARRFGWSLVRCGGTAAAVTGITLAVMCCNGFGTFLRAPNPRNVGLVNVYLSEVNTDAYFNFDLTERENIELITRLHNSVEKNFAYSNIFTVADRIQNNPDSYRGAIRLELEYYTYNGYRKDCAVEISEETYREILRELAVPEAMANNCLDFHRDTKEILGVVDDNADNTIDGNGFTPLVKSGLTFEMVRDAIRKDCENVTFEKMFKCESGNYKKTVSLAVLCGERESNQAALPTGYYSTNETGSVTVYPWFKNTLALLSEYGIEVDFGISPDEYKTAFIVKSLPAEDGDVWYYQCYSGLRTNVETLFGLAGDENYISYYKSRNFRTWDSDKGEEIILTDGEIINNIKTEYQNIQAAKIDFSRAMELYPLCGSVYDVDTDYGSDHYILVLSDITGEDLAASNCIAEAAFFFIPAEHFDKVSGFFE